VISLEMISQFLLLAHKFGSQSHERILLKEKVENLSKEKELTGEVK
jgi:hypothetical protein